MNRIELEKLFHTYGVFDAAQFIFSAWDSILNSCYYKDIIISINERIKNINESWRNSINLEPLEENPKVNRVVFDKRPDFNIEIADVQVSMFYYQNMIIKSFFQECRNSLDILAQAANAACLAFRAKRIETIDFSKMKDVFHQQTYSQIFPDICGWFDSVYSSSEYLYVDNYCNRAKHTCSVQTKFQLPIFGNVDTAQSTILPFFRQNSGNTVQQDKQEVDSFIIKIYDFFAKSYTDFLKIIKQEIKKKVFLGNRYYTLFVYQQKFKSNPNNDFSMAYIECENGIATMPDEIQVLFVEEMQESETESRLYAANCPFKTIYIKDSSSGKEHNYIGKYITEADIGEDELYRFRKYKKVTAPNGSTPLWIEAMTDINQKGKFYHKNIFFVVNTNTDDDSFMNFVALPF